MPQFTPRFEWVHRAPRTPITLTLDTALFAGHMPNIGDVLAYYAGDYLVGRFEVKQIAGGHILLDQWPPENIIAALLAKHDAGSAGHAYVAPPQG